MTVVVLTIVYDKQRSINRAAGTRDAYHAVVASDATSLSLNTNHARSVERSSPRQLAIRGIAIRYIP